MLSSQNCLIARLEAPFRMYSILSITIAAWLTHMVWLGHRPSSTPTAYAAVAMIANRTIGHNCWGIDTHGTDRLGVASSVSDSLSDCYGHSDCSMQPPYTCQRKNPTLSVSVRQQRSGCLECIGVHLHSYAPGIVERTLPKSRPVWA